MEAIGVLFLGWLIGKWFGGGGDGFFSNLFHASHSSSEPAPTPAPDLTTTVVRFPTATPAGLPSWPGGWKAAATNDAIVQRAWALLPVMKMNEVKYETGPAGTWLAYYKHQFNGKTGVTAHEPRTPLPAAQPPIAPSSPTEHSIITTSAPAEPPAPAASPAPSSPRPKIRKGSRGEAVKAWQRAIGVDPDGNFGKGTEAATKAWQRSHGLTPDGVVGPDTWATV